MEKRCISLFCSFDRFSIAPPYLLMPRFTSMTTVKTALSGLLLPRSVSSFYMAAPNLSLTILISVLYDWMV